MTPGMITERVNRMYSTRDRKSFCNDKKYHFCRLLAEVVSSTVEGETESPLHDPIQVNPSSWVVS